MTVADSSVDTAALEREPRPAGPATERRRWDPDSQFRLGLASAVAVGAIVRFVYLYRTAPALVLGDGYDYHLSALRLADGLGYTSAVGDVGAELAPPSACLSHTTDS